MTAPFFEASYGGTYARATGAVTATGVTTAIGDVLVAVASTEDNALTLGLPSGGTGITWTPADVSNVASYGKTYMWSSTASAVNSGVTISSTRSAAAWAGIRVYRFSSSSGVGAVNKANAATGTPSVALTTTQDDSAIMYGASDWNAVDGTGRAYGTVNGGAHSNTGYQRDASYGAAYSGYWANAGTAGSKTCTQTAPALMKWVALAFEVKGIVSAPAILPDLVMAPPR